MNDEAPQGHNATSENGEQKNLDQIREILFGSQSREINNKFQHVTDQLAEAIGGLRSLITERTDSLSHRLDEEIRQLQNDLNESRRLQSEGKQELDNKLTNTANELRQQVGAISETMSAAEHSIRNDLDKGLDNLKQHLYAQMEAVRDQINHDISQVSRASVTRRSFRDALRELSSQFDDE